MPDTALQRTLSLMDAVLAKMSLSLASNNAENRNEHMRAAEDVRAQIRVTDAVNEVVAMNAQMETILAALIARKAVVVLPDIIIPAAQLLTLTLGEKTFANLDCVGLKTTDTLLLTVKSMDLNYGLRGFSVPADGKVTIKLQCPVLTLGGNPIVFGATAFR